MQRAGVRAPVIWRGMGCRDGGEDVERFRRAVFDGRVRDAASAAVLAVAEGARQAARPAVNARAPVWV